MFKRTTSIVLALTLLPIFGQTVLASGRSGDETSKSVEKLETRIDANNDAKQKKNLRAEMLKLVEDTKAGKVAPPVRSQIQPARSNSLSKGAKIAIGVGIAVVVIALIVKHQKDHLFDNFNLNGLAL